MENNQLSAIPAIKTAHLSLLPLTLADADTLFRIYQTEGVLQYFPNPDVPPVEKVQRFILGQQVHWQNYGYGNWGIWLDGQQTIIGWAGLQYLPELDETEVGFLLDRPFWGKGYATEVARASLAFGFEHFDMDHMIALVHPDNLASRRVIDKCRMSFVETISLWGMNLRRYSIERS